MAVRRVPLATTQIEFIASAIDIREDAVYTYQY